MRKRLNNQMAAVMLKVIPSFWTTYSENILLISANTYGKYIRSEEWYTTRHAERMWFLPKCRYHIVLIGNVKQSRQNKVSVFADRMEIFKKTKFELEMIKYTDCFSDGHVYSTSNLGSFKIESFWANHYLNSN